MHTKNLLITLSTLLLFASTTLDAKTPKEPCSTSVECDAMAEDLQGKIDVLEAKGLENLTDDEFAKLDTLQDKLLAVKNVQVAQRKEELAQAKAKKEVMLKAQNKELAEIKKIFKENTK